jgi:chlorobactene glucosyltransferase
VLAVIVEFSLIGFLAVLLWFAVLVWLIMAMATVYGVSRQKILAPAEDLRLTTNTAPMVSILVPARNEEHRVLADCLRSILKQDYGRFEVIAVNDRSTDATGTILESIAAADTRLRVIEGEEPPPSWLGKPFAMHQALKHARGEWILATDADMIFDSTALRTAMANAVGHDADALSLIPYFEAHSFWERVMMPTWAWMFLMFTIFYRTNEPQSRRAVGIGGFFLMRRATLDRAGSYEALKDEVMEDVRLADRIKRSGGKLITDYAPELVSTRMYRNFGEMWECCSKNLFSGMSFSLPLAVGAVFSMYLIAIVPPLFAVTSSIAVASGMNLDLWQLLLPAAFSWVIQILVLMLASIKPKVSLAYAFTAPLGLGVLYAILLESSIRITVGKGVTWKGRTIYDVGGVRPPQPRSVASRFSKNNEDDWPR